jgi:hypothetical protein
VDDAEAARNDAANSMRNARFHFVMASAAMYMAMILTNWSNYRVGVEEAYQTSDFGPLFLPAPCSLPPSSSSFPGLDVPAHALRACMTDFGGSQVWSRCGSRSCRSG